MKQETILFDINETVLNLNVLKPKFKQYFGDEKYMLTWFSMLLHSSTVCLTTHVKTNFAMLAKAALSSLAGKCRVTLAEEQIDDILGLFANLEAHSDIKPALTLLKKHGFRVVALSNSSQALLEKQLTNAGLKDYFDDIISVESAGTFKPSAAAYQYAAETLLQSPENLRLVATHDWDTHGALSAGLKAAYIDRTGAPYHPLYLKPDIVGADMLDIAKEIALTKQEA